MAIHPHERLLLARQKAGFSSATEAARRFGWNENTYRSHENGDRGLGKSAFKYSLSFGVTVAWLLTGDGPSDIDNIVEIAGKIANKGLVTFISNSDDERLVDSIFEGIHLPIHFGASDYECYIFSSPFGGRYDAGDLVICWGSEKYNDRYLADGIISLDERNKCMQIQQSDQLHRVQLVHRFVARDLSDATFLPVKAIIRRGQYASHHERIVMAALTDDDGPS